MDMRVKPYLIIRTLKRNCGSVSKTACELEIARTTVWRWKKRSLLFHGKLNERRMFRLSTKPHTIKEALSFKDKDNITQLRRLHGFEASKIKHILNLPVSVSTIHRIIKTKQLVRKYGYHVRPYYQETTHMHARNTKEIGYLQMDVKYLTPQLTGLTWTCFEYAVIDIYSRYKDAVILNQLDQDGAISALLEMLARLPFKPKFIQTDNGLEFQEKFLTFVKARGLKHHYVHKNTPNENAVIERSFRTDEDEFFFFKYKGARDYDDLRAQFTSFLHFYNTERPHLGINLQTPLEVVANVVID